MNAKAARYDETLGRWVRAKNKGRRRRLALRENRDIRNKSLFGTKIYNDQGLVKHNSIRCNLRTNAGLDWQACVMADYRAFGASTQHPSTAGTATTLTDSGQAWTTNQWANHIVIKATSAGVLAFGVCLSNTATVLTVDGWWVVGSWGTVTGANPATTDNYAILPGGAPHGWMALSSTVQSGAAGDTTLAGEYSTIGLSRALATSFTHTAASTSYSISKTYTFSGTGTVNSEAVFDAQNGGAMPFENAEPSAPTGVSGDTLAQTVTVNY